jgi:hypothetical protein
MVKRFSLVLTDHDFYEFLRAFPDYGERTNLLRKAVRQLVRQAKLINNTQIQDLVDTIYKPTPAKEGDLT